MPRLTLLLVLSLLAQLPAGLAFADVYKFVDGGGHVFYTDNPKHSGFKLILHSAPQVIAVGKTASYLGAKPPARGHDWAMSAMQFPRKSAAHELRRQEFAPLIEAAADRYNLDPALLHAVIRAESGYNPEAVSNKGAAGLMQLMPATANRFGVRDRFDPYENVQGGARYLSELLDMFPSNLKLAVAAYNSGENTVKKYGYQVPPIAETQNYVEKVLGYYYR